ncbi:MAG TPA: glycosyltransferase family 4 protein [Steroidobacteraceae bacterium]
MPSVLLVSHHYPPHIGGLGLVVQKQAESMARNGYQVVVLTSRYGRVRDADRGGAGIHIAGVPCSHILERVFNIPFPLFCVSLLWRAWRLVRTAQVTHIHDVFYLSSWVAGACAIFLRKPMVVTQHVGMVDHSSGCVMLVQRLVYATFGRWLFSRACKVVVYNQNVHSFLRSIGVPEERILFLSNGIDTAAFRPATQAERVAIRQRFGLPQERSLVLFVGRLVEKKGYHILLAARDPAYELVFVGPGPVPTDGRIESVHWLGPLDQDQTAELFRACDLFAFPAVGEIFTLVMQEAMASGLPVVTTDDPAYCGSIVSHCITVSPREAASFREAIARTLGDPAAYSRLSAESRNVAVQNFDWRKNFHPLEAVYSQILDGLSRSDHPAV